jgi:hypothetical protein
MPPPAVIPRAGIAVKSDDSSSSDSSEEDEEEKRAAGVVVSGPTQLFKLGDFRAATPTALPPPAIIPRVWHCLAHPVPTAPLAVPGTVANAGVVDESESDNSSTSDSEEEEEEEQATVAAAVPGQTQVSELTHALTTAMPPPAFIPRAGIAVNAGVGGESESDDCSSSDSEEEGEDELLLRLGETQLFKLGEFCCDVAVTFVKGNQQAGRLGGQLHINQRASLDRCRGYAMGAGNKLAVWRFGLVNEHGRSAYESLCDYFVEKQRVGLVATDKYDIYIIPPATAWMQALGMSDCGEIVGLQVPKEDVM